MEFNSGFVNIFIKLKGIKWCNVHKSCTKCNLKT